MNLKTWIDVVTGCDLPNCAETKNLKRAGGHDRSGVFGFWVCRFFLVRGVGFLAKMMGNTYSPMDVVYGFFLGLQRDAPPKKIWKSMAFGVFFVGSHLCFFDTCTPFGSNLVVFVHVSGGDKLQTPVV